MPLTPPVTTHHHPVWSLLTGWITDDLERLIEHFFSATDNLLYDLSKRAGNNTESAFYFDAMREMRLIRHQHLRQFLSAIGEAANARSAGELAPVAESLSLDLLSHEALDRVLARDTLVNQVKGLYQPELDQLRRVLSSLSPRPISRADLPFSPEWLAATFADELPILNAKILVVVLKQFEKHVLRQLEPLYRQCLEQLAHEGYTASSMSGMGRLPRLKDIATSLDDPSPNPSLLSFALPLHNLRQVLANARFRAANDPGLHYQFAFNPGPVIPLPLLGRALTQAQHQLAGTGFQPTKNQLKDYVARALQPDGNREANAVNPYHEDIIQLVAAFFDEILDDKGLTSITQALVCRLQIPVLKVALHNENLFTDPEHSVRRYINLLTELAQTVTPGETEQDDPLYSKLFSSVKAINTLFDFDEGLFAREYDTLHDWHQQEKARADIIEQRSCQAEQGRERFDRAKRTASECLAHYAEGRLMSEVVREFIEETWQQVLVLAYLKDGQGPQWLAHSQTLNDLLWLDNPPPDPRSQNRVQVLMTQLPERLLAGLLPLFPTQADAEVCIESILQALNSGAPRQSQPRLTAIQKQQERFQQLSHAYKRQAQTLTIGSWCRLRSQGDRPVKLAGRFEDGHCLFVNRLGMKVRHLSGDELALAFQTGEITILNQEPLFERIMDKVVSQLRGLGHKLHNGAQPVSGLQ